VRRDFYAPLFVAAIAALAVASLSWLSYRSVRTGYQTEFARRLEGMAATGASQVRADDVDDATRLGQEGVGYLTLQVLIQQLCATPGTANASLLDVRRIALYDCRGDEWQGQRSMLDSLAHPALARALAGETAVSPPFAFNGLPRQVAFSPVRGDSSGAPVVAVVAVEAVPGYRDALAQLGQQLLLVTVLITLTLFVLAIILARRALAAARLERRLSRAENLAAMGRLTATLAHEIKNPLAIIRASARRLEKLEPEAQKMSEYVVEEVDRLSATVTRYLQFAKGEDLPEGSGDARSALDATLALLEGECQARRVTVERNGPEPLAGAWPETAPVRLDPESLKQVFLNLLLNALDAMADGGALTVALAERGADYEIAITDTGPGIAPDTLRRLGDPFVTTKAQGSGLGLFLTRRLVRSAGGTLDIESVVGRGTTCRVRLPRRRES
jgi:signal transduction histidine kinase